MQQYKKNTLFINLSLYVFNILYNISCAIRRVKLHGFKRFIKIAKR